MKKIDKNITEGIKKLVESQQGVILKVKPNAPNTEIQKIEKNTIYIKIKEPPEEGKANAAIEKFFKKLLEKEVKLIGKKGRTKILKLK